jgi:translocation and assembly module TamA
MASLLEPLRRSPPVGRRRARAARRNARARLVAGLAAAVLACAGARAAEPLAEVAGLPEGAVLEVVRAAIGEEEAPPATLFEARRQGDRARDRAIAALRSEGYYGARVDMRVEPGETPRPRLEIASGPRFVLGVVTVQLIGVDTEAALAAAREAAGLARGAPARAGDVLAAETRAVAAVEAAGYPDVRALDRVVRVDHARAAMDVTLRIDTGRAAVFGPVEARGTARLRAAWLSRVAPFVEGEPYDRTALDTFSNRLRDTGAFQSAMVRLADSEGPGAGPEARSVLAEIDVGPRRTITLGASYSTSEGGGVEGSWARRNVLRGAEIFTVSAALRTIERRLGVELAAPHWRLPGRTLRLETSVSDETTDAYDSAAFEAGARLERRLSPRLSRAIGTGVTISRVDDGTSTEEFQLAYVSGSFTWDGADDALDPRRGLRASASARPTAGFGDDPVGYVVAQGAASAYQPLGSRVTAAVRTRIGGIVGPSIAEIPANERFFAGGGGSIRGYEYQSVSPRDADGTIVGGRSVVELSAELRYRGEGRLGYVLFADGGAASDGLTPETDELRWGAGVGVRYYTRIGPIRADVAAPLDPRDGEPPAQLYLSIGQAF